MKIHCAFPRLLLQVLPDVLLHEYRSIWFCLYNAMPFLCSGTFVFSVNSDSILTGSPACSLGVPIKYIADISKLQTSFLWNLIELRKQLKQLDLAIFEASNWLKAINRLCEVYYYNNTRSWNNTTENWRSRFAAIYFEGGEFAFTLKTPGVRKWKCLESA